MFLTAPNIRKLIPCFKSNSGFSLIELMVAIIIIAIIASVGLVNYSQSQLVAKDSKRKSDIQEIQKALEQYYSASNPSVYPANINTGGPIDSKTYFQSGHIPKDPNGSDYTLYRAPDGTTCFGYMLCAKLDGTSGNHSTDPASQTGCDIPEETTIPKGYYCVGSQQN